MRGLSARNGPTARISRTRPVRMGAHQCSAGVPDGRMRLMTELDEHGRPEPPPAADEAATLLGFLDYQRATLA